MINLSHFYKLIQSAKLAFGSFLSMRERGEDTFEPSCHLQRDNQPVYQVSSPEHPFGIWKPDEMKQADLSFSFILPPSLPLPDLTAVLSLMEANC